MTDDDAAAAIELAEWNTRFAKMLFNETWELIDKEDRTGDEDLEMLLSAMASRWHWGRVGGPVELATGDWQIAHVSCLLHFGTLGLVFANRNLASALALGWDGWRLASAHEGVARACAEVGDDDGFARHYAEAEAALEREPDAEDRELIVSQLASIPRKETPT